MIVLNQTNTQDKDKKEVSVVLLEDHDWKLNREWEKTRDLLWGQHYNDPGADVYEEFSSRIALISFSALSFQVGSSAHQSKDGSLRLLGGCRLVSMPDATLLPMGAKGGVSLPKGEPGIEVSRTFIHPEFRRMCDPLLRLLVEGIEQALVEREHLVAYATILDRLYRHLCSIGVPMKRIGENTERAGKVFVPVKMLVRDPVATLKRRQRARCAEHRTKEYALAA